MWGWQRKWLEAPYSAGQGRKGKNRELKIFGCFPLIDFST